MFLESHKVRLCPSVCPSVVWGRSAQVASDEASALLCLETNSYSAVLGKKPLVRLTLWSMFGCRAGDFRPYRIGRDSHLTAVFQNTAAVTMVTGIISAAFGQMYTVQSNWRPEFFVWLVGVGD